MINQVQVINTFPSVSIPSYSDKLPVEVSLIAQLGHGSGNILLADIANRQKNHENFVDELDEPSAKIGGANFEKGDPTSLYSFLVGEKGHPFHRHAGHRIFTAISGSGGAQLRFSPVSSEQIEEDPQNFIRALRFVNIPADCFQKINENGREAEVILGFDDKHLSFRSSVGVKILGDFHAEISLGNRVHCKNIFGTFYLKSIDLVHRHYVVPTMLKTMAGYVVNHRSFE